MWRDVGTGNAVERAAMYNALTAATGASICVIIYYYYFNFPRYFYKKRKEKRRREGMDRG